jgi:N-acetylglucosamine kinase-like BadF-type ATPase
VSVFLGVDGGGTKTACCLLDREGRVVAQAQAPSSYYFTEGIELVGRVLRQGVDEVCRQAGLTPADIAYAFVGLPSYGEVSRDLSALDAAPGEALGHHRYACGNDMICGWAGSLGGSDGINVISGTGSMTYGERAGRGARVGGWGELFGDEGSAYWIAIRGLNAFSRMSDGVLPSGPLHGLLRERLALESDFDLIDVVLNRWQGGRGEIAELSRTVVEAASAGDTCAAQILADAAGELAGMVDATRRRLSFGVEESVPVSFSGGMFTAEPVLYGFKVALEAFHSGYELREPLYPPVVGAALYAAKLAGEPLDDAALSRLRSNSQEQPQPS